VFYVATSDETLNVMMQKAKLQQVVLPSITLAQHKQCLPLHDKSLPSLRNRILYSGILRQTFLSAWHTG